ncbi:PorT family protein [Antarcticibacterium sp. 1MA-6-2]|uniref:porin family protein n=1 Tax=Antarcticibacterium sp. 1MA-6-2 TaxID=2908210 RepID=UPI001F2C07A2|nr:porin family protein [Antarcticibacterium sp. 1MA-6-2]UJH92902.1 PorT family protein [Antarcticibacterium sp. 1MA-6-2]
MGFVSELLLGGKLFIAPELLYSSQGATGDEMELKLNYLQIPVMGRYYFIKSLNVEIGPQLGILLGSSGEIKNSPVSNDDFENIDLLIAFGVGYKLSNLGFL